MEYVRKHTTENHILMVLMVKTWWFVMAFVMYLWYICDGVRIFCDVLGAGLLMSFHGSGIVVYQLWSPAFSRKHEVWAWAREWRVTCFFFFFCNWDGAPRDLLPNGNSVLCILVSFISHRPDRKGTLASDLKGAGARAPRARHCMKQMKCLVHNSK